LDHSHAAAAAFGRTLFDAKDLLIAELEHTVCGMDINSIPSMP
jgi:hypothetical protein